MTVSAWTEWAPEIWRAEFGSHVVYVRRLYGSWAWMAVGGPGESGFADADAAKAAAESLLR